MKTILIGLILLILFLVAGPFLYREHYVKRKLMKLALQKYKIVEPLMHKLAARESITDIEILMMAKDPSLRCGLFRILKVTDSSMLFPVEYLTHEKAAEGYLVNWLEFPTELGAPPDEIEFHQKITIHETEALDYYVFKYKTKAFYWKQHPWMMGVAGPYQGASPPYEIPRRIFSRFNTIDSISAQAEVEWVHKNIKAIT